MKDKIIGLISVVDDETNFFIIERLSIIRDYVFSVLEMEMQLPILSRTFNPTDYATKRNELDTKRHQKHDLAIDAVHQLNRICELNDYPVLYIGSNTRRDIADFCFEIVESFYKERL